LHVLKHYHPKKVVAHNQVSPFSNQANTQKMISLALMVIQMVGPNPVVTVPCALCVRHTLFISVVINIWAWRFNMELMNHAMQAIASQHLPLPTHGREGGCLKLQVTTGRPTRLDTPVTLLMDLETT
jgi:hypothetical protein